MRTLIGESFSPWTEKARWALDHHGLSYSLREYQPLIDEPWLRMKTRNLRAKATVPVLLNGADILGDSTLIARHAEATGSGAPLFPETHAGAVDAWMQTSDHALGAARSLFFTRLASDHAALLEYVPPFIPLRARGLLVPAVRMTVRHLRAKHAPALAVQADTALGAQAGETLEARAHDQLDLALAALRDGLAGSRYLLGELTYADIAMSVVCQFVKPVSDRYIHLSPAVRACWTEGDLARKHQDLLEWRDALYASDRVR